MTSKGRIVLDLPMGENDARANTVAEYLKEILIEVMRNGESFSGKRPFGNSGWEWELYAPLVKAGLVNGSLEAGDHKFATKYDRDKADELIEEAIYELS